MELTKNDQRLFYICYFVHRTVTRAFNIEKTKSKRKSVKPRLQSTYKGNKLSTFQRKESIKKRDLK